MKQGMTSVDVAALAAEIAPLVVGGRVDRAYQPAKDQVLLRVRRKGTGRVDLLFQLGRFVTVTRRPPENPGKPSMLAQVLRTNLENGRVVGLRQVGFDRVLRLDVERGDGRHALVLEVFGDGNLLLLDGDDRIVLPMRGTDYAARSLRKGEPYLPPPGPGEPFGLGADGLRTLAKAARRDVIRMLAAEAGFGPLWAEELCLRAGVPKGTTATDLDDGAIARLDAAIAGLGRDIRRNDLAPAVVHEDGQPVDAVPFVMQRYPAPRFAHEEAPSFRAALDALFVGTGADDEEEPDDPRRGPYDQAHGKLGFQVRQGEEAVQRFLAEEAARQAEGELLYTAFQPVQEALDALRAAHERHGWGHVQRVLDEARRQGHPAARLVADLHPHEGEAVLRLDSPSGPKEVTVDVRLSVQENAQRRFDAAKRARQKRDGAENALKDARARLAAMERRGLDGFGASPVRAEAVRRHFWFEPYRWTTTPSGLLAVGGRNAGQNDAVVKKYLREGDRYVHADIHGAPSVVVRHAEGPAQEVPEEDLRVAGQFAVCASRAWRQFGHASAYWVTAAQVSKTPRSGEFVPRGAWIIHGRRSTIDHLPTDWWVGQASFTTSGVPIPKGDVAQHQGRAIRKLVGGPREGLEPFCGDLLHVVPGDIDPNLAAPRLARRFAVTVEAAQAVLPAGPVAFPDGLPDGPGGDEADEGDAA